MALMEDGTPRPDRQTNGQTDRQTDNAQLCPGDRVVGRYGMLVCRYVVQTETAGLHGGSKLPLRY